MNGVLTVAVSCERLRHERLQYDPTARNSRLHHRLKNWGAFKRVNTGCGPMEDPMPASWQGKVTDDYPPDKPFEEHYIDEDDAMLVQKAIVLCMVQNGRVALILTQHYHYRTRYVSHLVHEARNKFWRYLY